MRTSQTTAITTLTTDIVDAPSDCICTSTNPHLDLMLGTGGAVREKGGWSIQEECHAIIAEAFKTTGKRYLQPGSAVITSAGKLAHRAVIHCVAIDAFHDSTPEIIQSCIHQALDLAAAITPPIQSIAIPILATGHGHLDIETSLTALLDGIQSHTRPPKFKIVLITRDPESEAKAKAILKAQDNSTNA